MDEYVASARSHWGPRFTANGVPAADFARVVDGLESWDDWCAAWSAAASVHEDLGIEALEQGRLRSAGAHLSTAAVVYHFAKFVYRPRSGADARRPRGGRPVSRYRSATPGSAGGTDRDTVRGLDDLRDSAQACGPTAPSGRDLRAWSGLHQGGAASHRGPVPRPRPGHLQRRRPRAGRGRVRPADPRRLGGARPGIRRRPRRARRHRRRSDRRLGSQPRRVLRTSFRQR